MESIRADVALREPHGFSAIAGERKSARELLVHQLRRCADRVSLPAGLRALTQYVSASHYLLVRQDLSFDSDIDFVVASDWPFDMVRSLAGSIAANHVRMSEFDRCCNLMQPSFSQFSDDVAVPAGVGREYCAIVFNVGRVRMALLLLFPEHFILSQSKLRDVGLLTGYLASICCRPTMRLERESDLTDREIECLYWIAEGKTSDEIAVILGISRNTINNYIASVMRKTATKTRSEAIAWAVRNNLV